MPSFTRHGGRARSSALREERGSALVEFAIVFNLLIVLVLGMVWFGRALNYWLDANHMASSGARYAVVNKNPGADEPVPVSLQDFIKSQADTDELAGAAEVCIELPDGGSEVGDAVKVTVSADYEWLPIFDVGASTTLAGSAEMRLEQVPTAWTTADNDEGCV